MKKKYIFFFNCYSCCIPKIKETVKKVYIKDKNLHPVAVCITKYFYDAKNTK